MENQYVIYSPKSTIHLLENKAAAKSKLKGVIDFVHYLNYRDSVEGTYTLFSSDVKELKQQFFSQFNIVKAAGGLVFNEKNQILLIHRRGFWDLPKGKFEKKESKRECALREVQEETGICDLKVLDPLSLLYNGKKTTYHIYRYKRKQTIKPTYWYIMYAPKQKLFPQTEEDIDQAVWVSPKKISNYYSEMYPAIRDVVQSALEYKQKVVLK